MKKQILNLGKALTKVQQQAIHGGKFICCYSNPICPPNHETSCIVIGGVCEYYPNEGVPC